MSLPTRAECLELLNSAATYVPDTDSWVLSGHPYTTGQAVKIAELCLITDRPLSAVGTADLFLDLARRIAALEDRCPDA